MEKRVLYTIGHGIRKADEFLSLLKEFTIAYLIDVRSQPYSKFNPQFNQKDLKLFLEQNGITYVFMGDTLGGRPQDHSCYNGKGQVDYEIVKTKYFFLQGINRLRTAYSRGINVAIMCSETKPCECHRTKLIGRVLSAENIEVLHIDEKGKLKDQACVIKELNKGFAELDLFGAVINVTSEKAFL